MCHTRTPCKMAQLHRNWFAVNDLVRIGNGQLNCIAWWSITLDKKMTNDWHDFCWINWSLFAVFSATIAGTSNGFFCLSHSRSSFLRFIFILVFCFWWPFPYLYFTSISWMKQQHAFAQHGSPTHRKYSAQIFLKRQNDCSLNWLLFGKGTEEKVFRTQTEREQNTRAASVWNSRTNSKGERENKSRG